ncbi:hypothetical protein SASPL_146700 [Salvia splendens]|uniref:Large ribosomal subunit protein bL12 oligomerization domain-containing protein n=1 Tax=Salvia splendens TaxID=180675 RepID=A0A8X8WD57_SALSN|nr:hypothetical protein SASPL_146700 [Salvia splendens]
MASALSYVTLHTPSCPTPSTAHPAPTFPRHTIEFPLKTSPPHLRRCTTHLRPLAAVDAPEKVVELGDQISNLTLADAQKLVEYLQDKLGVSAASFAPAAAAVAPPAAGDAAPAVEEKTEFDVVIDDVPSNSRIATIKVGARVVDSGCKLEPGLADLPEVDTIRKNMKDEESSAFAFLEELDDKACENEKMALLESNVVEERLMNCCLSWHLPKKRRPS